MRKPRKLLLATDLPCIRSIADRVATLDKTTLVFWAVDYCETHILPIWTTRFPDDARPLNALLAAKKWMKGEIKLPQARFAILDCHQAAREADAYPAAQSAARAIGQSASTIHVPRHCLGLVHYGTLAISYHILGVDAPWEEILVCAALECERMKGSLLERTDENYPSRI